MVVNLKCGAAAEGYFFLFLFFFLLLSQSVAKLNVLVREMSHHQQPEVSREARANFSFTSLSIANVLVFTAAEVAGL